MFADRNAIRALLLVSSQKWVRLPIAPVGARRPAVAELPRRADDHFVDRPRRHVLDEQLAGRRRDVGRAEQHAVGVEVRVDGGGQVAVPRRGARQRARRRVVGRVAGKDRVAAVVGPGRRQPRLDHLAERDVVHLVLHARLRHESGQRLRRILLQALAEQRVVAGEHAGVERPVAPPDGVVQLEALRLVLGVDRRHQAEALLLEGGGVEDRRAVEAQTSARHGDRPPAVRAADQVLGVDVALIADVQVVPERPAESDVVGDLPGLRGRSCPRRTSSRSRPCRRRPSRRSST